MIPRLEKPAFRWKFIPSPYYVLLPFPMEAYNAYTPGHVMAQMQLLLFSTLVFFLLLPMLKRTNTVSLNFDWFYHKGDRHAWRTADTVLTPPTATPGSGWSEMPSPAFPAFQFRLKQNKAE
jgi:multicomponent Na+:H+ antiporter subunit D